VNSRGESRSEATRRRLRRRRQSRLKIKQRKIWRRPRKAVPKRRLPLLRKSWIPPSTPKTESNSYKRLEIAEKMPTPISSTETIRITTSTLTLQI
jgi:hypothetical protein